MAKSCNRVVVTPNEMIQDDLEGHQQLHCILLNLSEYCSLCGVVNTVLPNTSRTTPSPFLTRNYLGNRKSHSPT